MRETNRKDRFKAYDILYVEDTREISEEVAFFLEPRVKKLYTAYDGEEGVASFEQHRPDIIITDIQMPKMNGIKMIEAIRLIDPEVPIIITTAFNETDYLLQAVNLGVDGYLMKPLSFKELMNRLEKIVEPLELRRELIEKNRELEDINANLDQIVQEKTKKLEYFYNHDPLTGLSNFVKLGEEIKTGSYKHLILLDISNFSTINKQYGKEFANLVLNAAAIGLTRHTVDLIRLFKTESDRFVILMKEENIKEVELFCQQVVSFFDTQPIEVEEVEIYINFTMSIARIDGDAYPMVNAEYALDIGKELGSRYYYLYNDSADSVKKAKDAIKWLNITKSMIQNDQIEPYFQAIVDASTGEVVKYEALARGLYKGEVLSPYFFIGSAERLGLIGAITRMIVKKSFDFFEGTGHSFSINITQRDLLDDYLIPFLEQKLEAHAITPAQVTFEILENVTIGEHHTLVLKQLKALKAIGFKIAIDDFGVESSNFSRLLEIDFDYIKLDGLFIRQLDKNEKDRVIVSAIVSLARSLGIQTIAEFVENETLFEIIKGCGVDMAQGYHLGKPLSRSETVLQIKKEQA